MTFRISILLALSVSGCAATAALSATPAQRGSAYEPMSVPPPDARKEDAPRLAADEVWVPGYYSPIAGSWVWHQGEVRPVKDGYTLIAASIKEDNGKYLFSPPRWRRNDLAQHAQ